MSMSSCILWTTIHYYMSFLISCEPQYKKATRIQRNIFFLLHEVAFLLFDVPWAHHLIHGATSCTDTHSLTQANVHEFAIMPVTLGSTLLPLMCPPRPFARRPPRTLRSSRSPSPSAGARSAGLRSLCWMPSPTLPCAFGSRRTLCSSQSWYISLPPTINFSLFPNKNHLFPRPPSLFSHLSNY